jgi:HK97 family phage major capsid protein
METNYVGKDQEMALKQLLLTKRMSGLNAQLTALRALDAGFETRSTALKLREAEIEEAVKELADDASEEDKKVVEDSATALETDQAALDKEKSDNDAAKTKLEDDIRALQTELDELNSRAKTPPASTIHTEERKETHNMKSRVKFFGMDREERAAFFANDSVKSFIGEVRAIKTRGITNGALTIPDIMLELLRDNLEQYSKLVKYINLKPVAGTARQNIIGSAPEGVWMEATGSLNELDMSLNQIEVDGYMVGGIIYVHNTLLEDSDIALGSEVMSQLGKAIGKGVDRAILYGTGTKTPVGIITRLAQTAAPSTWGTYAPAWTDLHTTNVIKLNINATTGATFFASLIAALGVAKPNYTDGGCFWVMNRKTHILLMTKALEFNASAALVAGINGTMPIIGGEIVELEIVGDNEIVGGFGSAYLLAERAGAKVDSSEHVKFKEMMTGFRGYARYDGQPVFGEAFVVVSFDNTDAATTSTFPIDYANTALCALGVTSVAGTASGDTLIAVTGKEVSGTTFGYIVGGKAVDVKTGDAKSAYTAWDGSADITAATGKIITVVEFDGNSRAIKAGSAQVVAKA